MPYFSLTENGNLLTSAARDCDGIGRISKAAELDVIGFYTEATKDALNTPLSFGHSTETGAENLSAGVGDPAVYLRFYKANPDDLTTPQELAFKAAMQNAIAAQIESLAEDEGRDSGVKRVKRGRRDTEYFEHKSRASSSLSRRARNILEPYDTRPVL